MVESAATLISQCQNKYGKSRVIVPKVTDKDTDTQKSLFLTTHQRMWAKVDEIHFHECGIRTRHIKIE